MENQTETNKTEEILDNPLPVIVKTRREEKNYRKLEKSIKRELIAKQHLMLNKMGVPRGVNNQKLGLKKRWKLKNARAN
jgi:hypothetical protein